MNGLPVGWASAAISDVAEVNPTPGAPLLPDSEVSFVPMAAVEAESGRIDTSLVRPFAELRKKSFRAFEEGDVLFAKITPCMENGKAAVARNLKSGRGFGSTEFHILRPHSGINPDFLLYFLLQKRFRDTAARNMKGTAGQLRVPTSYLAEHRVPIPPTAEQERIVAAIEEQFSRLDAAVVALERARRNLRGLRASVLQAAVAGQLVLGMDQPWETRLLPRLGTVDRGKSRHRPRNAPELYGGPYPFIQTGDVASAIPWIKSYSQTYNEKGLAQSRLWPNGTLCITIAANIAKTGILTFDACFPDSVVGFVADDGPTATRWVELILRQMQGHLEQLAPATAQKNINLAVLRALEIPYPELRYQALVVEEYDRQLSLVTSLEETLYAAIRQSYRLRSSIFANAFSGKLVAQDAGDEPAPILLERIAAERRLESNGHMHRRGRKL
jgi:type I restriction enzyme S subunit